MLILPCYFCHSAFAILLPPCFFCHSAVTGSCDTASAAAAGKLQHTFGYTADIESGKDKFLAAHHSPTERDYVAKYGQKAYRTASAAHEGVMPQPLTPGHTASVKIKALSEQEAAGPGTAHHLALLKGATFSQLNPIFKATSA